MIFITAILKEEKKMLKTIPHRSFHPFGVMVRKEVSDQVNSWRFLILVVIIGLTCLSAMYTSLSEMRNAVKPGDPAGTFFFLKIFTLSNGTLPAFFVFISFLGPLLGIGLGFDAINSEQSRGTLSRILSQPVHRDDILNAKFVASLKVIGILFFSLGFLVMGFGMVSLGKPPTPEEFLRIISFVLLSIVYVAFWLNLSILFSVWFKQPATSALAGIAVWLFFSVFYPMIVQLIVRALTPWGTTLNSVAAFRLTELKISLMRISPSYLFSEATTTLLMPSIRTLGPLTYWQTVGAIPSPLSLGQSLLLIWPQVTGLIAATVLGFALAYVSFMKREVRSR